MKMHWKNLLLFLALLGFWLPSGCATQRDLDGVQRDTNNLTKGLLALQRQVKKLSGKTS